MPAKPVTPAEFGVLVTDLRAELAVTEGLRRREFFTVPRRAAPDAFKGRPWVRRYADAYELEELTDMAAGAIKDLDRRARQARSEGRARGRRLMPASEIIDGERQWMIGEVALFVASRSEKQPPRPERTRPGSSPLVGLPSPTDEQLLDAVRRAMKQHGPGVSVRQARESVRAEGIGANNLRVSPMLIRARVEHIRDCLNPTGGPHGGVLESVRRDGLVPPARVAEAFGVSQGAITHAVERGRLTVVKYDPGPLFDPQRLAVRKDGTKGPVDKGSEYAVDMEADW